ncbi:MAG: methylated-DNA--[protein]-cysteine S-methyltransferase [Pyramidobacter sp.]|jgi:AraC family transcriptional regulator of adaptative response/methylated-DNA-[protein]-cysteine methyltransferase
MSEEKRTKRKPEDAGASALPARRKLLLGSFAASQESVHLKKSEVRFPELKFDASQRKGAERVKQIVQRYFADRPALNRALQDLGGDRKSLIQNFQSVFGRSPLEYFEHLRLEKAKAQLLAGESAARTAEFLGFGSASAFRAFFKGNVGLSPEDFAMGRQSARRQLFMDTPLGCLRIEESDDGILSAGFVTAAEKPHSEGARYLGDAVSQLEEYFAGKRTRFDLPLDLRGTEFQRAVWQKLTEIPFGQTRSYGQIAAAVGKPRAARAVGMANNRNPVIIIVPCHRVIGADGALVGYGAGIERKVHLLNFERQVMGEGNVFTVP